MLEFTLVILFGTFITIYIKTNQKNNKSTNKSFHKPYNENWKEETILKNQKAYKTSHKRSMSKVKTMEYAMYNKYKKQYNQVVGDLITIKDIAKHFKTTQKNITKILEELSWIEIKEKWVLTTIKGNFNGARQKYNTQTKMKYVLWEDDILENEELLKKLKKMTPKKQTSMKTTYKEKIDKGQEYEEYVAKVYRSRGYHVSEYGKQQGVLDHGIDLIAKKQKEIVLIQCKNWNENGKWEIKHKDIKAFQTDARTFVEDKPLLRSCLLTARYTISGNFIHPSAIKHIEEMKKLGKRVDYEIVKMPII